MLKKIRLYFRNRFPIVSRKRLELEKQQNTRYVSNLKAQHEEEVESLTLLAEQYLPKIAQANIDHPRKIYPMFRISMTFSEDLIRQSFTWGNNERELNYLSQIMARSIFKELLGINSSRYVQEFVKYEHDDFRRAPDFFTYPTQRID